MYGVLWWAGLAALGLGVGVIAGMFGVGGGFLLTPLLAVLFRVPLPIAVGTGLCQMIGTAMAAQIRYSRLGQGEAKLGWIMVGGSLLGARLGVRVVEGLTARGDIVVFGQSITAVRFWLSVGFIALLSGVALWMARDVFRRTESDEGPIAPGPLARLRLPPYTYLPYSGHQVSIPVIAYLGLGVGFLSGLLGIGGGVVLVPVLLYGIGMHVRTAAGTGIGVLLATSLVGTLDHARSGHVHLGIALMLMVGSALGAQIGATITARMGGQRLRGLFVYLVAFTAVMVLADLLRTLFAAS